MTAGWGLCCLGPGVWSTLPCVRCPHPLPAGRRRHRAFLSERLSWTVYNVADEVLEATFVPTYLKLLKDRGPFCGWAGVCVCVRVY